MIYEESFDDDRNTVSNDICEGFYIYDSRDNDNGNGNGNKNHDNNRNNENY